MPDQMYSVRKRQNQAAMLALLRAMSVSHARVQRAASIGTAVSITLAVGGLISVFVRVTGSTVTFLGAVWAIIYSTGLTSWTGKEMRRAATLQEMFDVRLFGLPWNPVLAAAQISAPEVNKLCKRFAGREYMIRDYYEVPADLPHPYDVLACQEQNLAWGARIRRRYAYTALGAVLGWSVLGLVIGGLADVTVMGLLLGWYLPSLGALILGFDNFRGQHEVAAERDRLLRLVRITVVTTARQPPTDELHRGLMTFARQVQDAIFLTRVRTMRVPDWFFYRFHADDRSDFQAAMSELEHVVRNAPTAPPGPSAVPNEAAYGDGVDAYHSAGAGIGPTA